MKCKVDGHSSIYKDMDTGVIVNRGQSERDRYRIAKKQAMQNLESQQEVSSLRQEVNELKSLIKQLLEK
jgi:hypothetical protein